MAETTVHVRPPVAAEMMGDIGEEVTEIELEPLPEEGPAEAPSEPAEEPVQE